MITSNFIMPGDNIRTFFDAYEEGLYYFRFERNPEYAGGIITIGKYDERSILPINIFYDNETVTGIQRHYRGTITDFEEDTIWENH